MKKLLLTIFLCGALLLCITGCGEKNNLGSLDYSKEEKKINPVLIKRNKNPENSYKTDDELRKIILRKAHISSHAQVLWNIDKRHYGNVNGKDYYSFQFIYKGNIYEYVISPVDGSVLSHNIHHNSAFHHGHSELHHM